MLVDVLIDAMIDFAIIAILGVAVLKLLWSIPEIRKLMVYIWSNRQKIVQKLKGIFLPSRNSQK